MDAAKAQVLFDISLLAIGALAIGLPLFAFLRHRDAEIGWHHHGNVWSAPFDRLDLAVSAFVVLYFMAQVWAPLFFAEELAKAQTAAADGGGTSILTAIVLSMVFNIALGAGVFSYASILRNRDPVQLFGLSRLRLVAILTWLAGGILVIYGLVILGAGIWHLFFKDAWGGGDDLQEAVKLLADTPDPMLRIVIVIAAVIVAPLVEEVIFRGFLYPVFKRYSDRFFAAATSALLFALVHGNVPGFLPLFLLGLGLALAYELSGCLWVPIALHAVFNALQSIGILVFNSTGGGG